MSRCSSGLPSLNHEQLNPDVSGPLPVEHVNITSSSTKGSATFDINSGLSGLSVSRKGIGEISNLHRTIIRLCKS